MPSSGRALLVFMHLGERGRDTLGQPEAVQLRTPTRGQLILPPGRFRPAGGGFTSRAAAQGGDATTPGSWAADNAPSLGHRLSFLGDPLTLPPAQPPAAITGRSLLWGDGPTCWPQGKGKAAPRRPLPGSGERATSHPLHPKSWGGPASPQGSTGCTPIHLLPQQHQVRCRAGHQELGTAPGARRGGRGSAGGACPGPHQGRLTHCTDKQPGPCVTTSLLGTGQRPPGLPQSLWSPAHQGSSGGWSSLTAHAEAVTRPLLPGGQEPRGVPAGM